MYKSSHSSDAVARYVNETITRETPTQRRLRDRTAKMSNAELQITPDQGATLSMLVKLTNAKHALEVGTFTGYSALAIASALPAEGKLVACDVSEEWTDIGRPYWEEARVADRIDLRLGPAQQTLEALLGEGAASAFDFAFIDADKEAYDGYYEATLKLLKHGGLIVFDNMLAGGRTADPEAEDSFAVSIRALNEKIRDDKRVDAALLTVGDGFLLARKR